MDGGGVFPKKENSFGNSAAGLLPHLASLPLFEIPLNMLLADFLYAIIKVANGGGTHFGARFAEDSGGPFK
jgi:hypothetical protein